MAIDQKYGRIDIPGIPDDEPVFILRGQDRLSGLAVLGYAELYVAARYGVEGERVLSPDESVRRSNFALAIEDAAAKLNAWPMKKIPD